MSFCYPQDVVWTGVQDGDGPWTRLDPAADGHYVATYENDRGAVVQVRSGPDWRYMDVVYGSTTELATLQCPSRTGVVSGGFAGMGDSGAAALIVGPGEAQGSFSAPSFTLALSAGRYDLYAGRNPNYLSANVDRVIIRRGVEISAGTSLPVLDFNSSESVALVSATVTVAGPNSSGRSAVWTTFLGAGRPMRDPGLMLAADAVNGTGSYPAIPAAALQSGELSMLQVLAEGRTVTTFYQVATDRAVTLGEELNVPATSWPAAGGPSIVLASQPTYGRSARSYILQNNVGRTIEARITVSANYWGGTPPAWEVGMPDLSGAEGWNADWEFVRGSPYYWEVSAVGGPDPRLGDPVHDGDTQLVASRLDTQTALHSPRSPRPKQGP